MGSEFSETAHSTKRLENASEYLNLIELVMQRGATNTQIRLLAGENTLRVWSGVELQAKKIEATGELPSEHEYDSREWRKGLKRLPWMLQQSQGKARVNGTAHNPYIFNVDAAGRHVPAHKNP